MLRHPVTLVTAARRVVLVLALAATSHLAGPGAPLPALADDPIVRDHRAALARLEVVIHQVKIHDDRDGFLRGAGEMRLYLNVWRCKDGAALPCNGWDRADLLTSAGVHYSASTGQTITLDRLVPQDGDLFYGDVNTAAQLGFGVSTENQYLLAFEQQEEDGLLMYDEMGHVHQAIDAADLGLGVHTARSVRDDGTTPGDYTITYEVLAVPLPDLQPVGFRVAAEAPTADRDDQVCFTVQNTGLRASDPFQVTIGVEGAHPAMLDVGAFGLAAGETREQCTGLRLPDAGDHQLSLVVDRQNAVAEMNDMNNLFEQILVRGQPATPSPAASPDTAATASTPNANPRPSRTGSAGPAGPTPTPKPGPSLRDLAISAIKVNGQVPDGKDDCKDGKSDVTVVVKNQGPKNAGDFRVRLVVDDAQDAALEQSADLGLEAGKELPLTFRGVRLKKGPHTLVATADPIGTVITESDESNNTLKVAARCTDGS